MIVSLFFIFLFILIVVGVAYKFGTVFGELDWPDTIFGGFLGTLVGGLLCGILWIQTACFTTGVNPDYASGHVDGYLVQQGWSGVIWKTYESRIQPGVGELASLDKPMCFTALDLSNREKLQQLHGKKVRVHYKCWLVKPYRYGDGACETWSVELLE